MVRQEKKKGITESMEVPQGVTISVANGTVTVAAGKAKESRNIGSKSISAIVEGNKVLFKSNRDSKTMRKMIGTLRAHVKNLSRGVATPHVYKLKICSGHFPMNVAVVKDELVVKNFLGEKVPRTVKIKESTKVKVDGDYIVVESSNIESAGQTAAAIETLTKRANYDKRVFQDGIYIISKDGEDI